MANYCLAYLATHAKGTQRSHHAFFDLHATDVISLFQEKGKVVSLARTPAYVF